MGRGKGKGKGRGGGKMFVANIEELQMREAQVQQAKQQRKNRRGDSDDNDSDQDSGSEEEDVEMSKDDLRELANFERSSRLNALKKTDNVEENDAPLEDDKPRGLLSGFKTQNPNQGSKNPKTLKTKDMLKNMANDIQTEPQMSRREREALEAQRKKAEYDRRHAAGETAEAKSDLARLAEVRKRREEAKAKREKEEARAKLLEQGLSVSDDEDGSDDEGVKNAKVSDQKKAAKKKAAAEEDTSDDIPILTSIEIKKLKPDMLKEHLKKRGLSLQGQKKELIQRLTQHEASRK